jgi:UPF0755 protein
MGAPAVSDPFFDDIVRPGGGGVAVPAAPESRSARRAGRAERDRRRRRRRRNVLALFVVLAVIGGAAFAFMKWGMPLIDEITAPGEPVAEDYPGPGHTPTEVEIPAGATGGDMATVLFDAGIVASRQAFITAFAANPSAPSIQPGTYRLLLQMKASEVVTALLNPENRVQNRVTIIEGKDVRGILETLSAKTTIPIEEFEAAMADTAATGLPAEAGGNYEGWMFPDTYSFEPGTTATQMIATMVAQMTAVLDARGVPVEDRLRVLTIASLVEREAGADPDRPMMARAIQNRLDQGMPLQIDASVAYGLNKPGTELTLEDTSPNATDNPYNTYAHPGLPPTPIAAPGAASIDAVLNPADGPWLFWVTINLETKETRFAETFAEHQQNVALLREWQAENQ